MSRRLSFALVATGSILLVGTAALAAPQSDPVIQPAQCEGLSVVTLNLYHDRDDWTARRPLVVEGLRELSPDVIVLQEVLQHATLRNQADDLAEALDYGWWFVSSDPPGSERRYGNAILSPHPFRHLAVGSFRGVRTIVLCGRGGRIEWRERR